MTKSELRDHILRQIGVLGVGGAASAEDAEFVELCIDNAQDELEQLEVALWTTDDIPGYVVESLALYCRPSVGPAFGFDVDPRVKAQALAQIRYLTADRRAGTGTATYF